MQHSKYPRSLEPGCHRWRWRGDKGCEPPFRTLYSERTKYLQGPTKDSNSEKAEKAELCRDELDTDNSFDSSYQVRNNTAFFYKDSNKREDTYTKMAEREMIRQVGTNPFLNNNYVDGIVIRDTVLMPYHESKPNTHTETS